MKITILFALLLLVGAAHNAFAQTTEFSYQGRLNEGAAPVNASYDFEFRLFSVESGGAALAIIQRPGVTVTNAVFSVALDFGANFDGAPRFLEIAVKPAASGSGFQTLAPRQRINSTPYAIRSLSSTNTENVGNLLSTTVASATQLVIASTSANTPNALVRRDGGGNFSANIINASQYNIGTSRMLSAPGTANTFVGKSSGAANTSGSNNTFGGTLAGFNNTTGNFNSFFGVSAGVSNMTGDSNSFFGNYTGFDTTGNNNSFFGAVAGRNNTTGSNNTLIGYDSDFGSENLTFATAIGSYSTVTTSNTIALGRSSGADRVLVYGVLDLNTLGSAGSTALCRNASGYISTCSSSLRYKTNVRKFSGGLELIRKLQPITFNWKDGGLPDVGFGAEEVAAVEPLLTTRNEKGEIEGVKYAQISTALVNAVNEQQTEIEQLKEQIKTQQSQIEALRKLVCALSPAAEICRSKEESK